MAGGRLRVLRFALVPVLFLAAATAPLVAATGAFQNVVLGDTPILYYQLNEATGNAINYGSLGNTHDAVYNGTIERGASTLAGDDGVAFSGVDDYLQSLGVAPASVQGNPTFTAEAIAFVPSTGGGAALYGPFLHWGPTDASATGESVYFSFRQNTPTEIFVGFYSAGVASPSGSFALGRWHHVVWVRTGGGAANVGSKLYIDGVDLTAMLVNDSSLCCNTATPNVGAAEFRINRARDLNRFFVGSLDEVALYDRALTAEEVSQHFTASGLGLAMDIDGNGVKDPLTDGILAVRYLFGFRGATLIAGAIGQNCTRCTAIAVEAYLASL